MTNFNEKWNKELVIDIDQKQLRSGKLTVAFDAIDDVACSVDGTLTIGKKNYADGEGACLLCIHMTQAVAQPGKLFGLGKSNGIVLRMESEKDAREAMRLLQENGTSCLQGSCGSKTGNLMAEQSVARLVSEDFSADKCIIEAKKGCCDYIRGGTPGSRPYDKPGLVVPIIMPKYDLSNGRIQMQYIGTNGYHQESAWFSAHPGDWFELQSADMRNLSIILKDNGCTVKALYQCNAIEKDENATGIWQVELEKSFGSVCDGARWLEMLRHAENGSIAEDADSTEEVTAVDRENAAKDIHLVVERKVATGGNIQGYDKTMLLAALDLLHAANVLTDEEWEMKRKLI